MGLLDSVVGMLGSQQRGSAAGGELLNVVVSMLANGSAQGGLGGLVEKLQRGGLGEVVASWISTGPNMPINGDQLGQALGPDVLSQIAQQLGVSRGDAANQLSQVLPRVVDKLTPDGSMPEEGLGSMAEILGRFR